MKRLFPLFAALLLLSGCAILSELTAFTKCEFSFHSAIDPKVSGVDVSAKRSFSDFTLLDGQMILSSIMKGTLPFEITANVEVRNPGSMKAAVNSLQWIAYIDDVQVTSGTLSERVEVAPGGGRSMIPVRIQADLFEYLEGDNPRTMANFALNLADAGGQPTRLSMKIKPSVLVGTQSIYYPGYFTISKEFTSGD